METVMLDSSVWISHFANDCHTINAKKILSKIETSQGVILIPSIIYAEIFNNLTKLDRTNKLAEVAERTFKNKKFRLINPNKDFWFKKFKKYPNQVALKTMDLAILAIAFEFNVDQLYSFDVKLQKAYKYLKRHYEEKEN